MHKSSLSPNDYGVFPLESDMQGNLPVSFGKGATEKGWKAPRRCPTSFGEGQLEKGQAIGTSPAAYPTTRSAIAIWKR